MSTKPVAQHFNTTLPMDQANTAEPNGEKPSPIERSALPQASSNPIKNAFNSMMSASKSKVVEAPSAEIAEVPKKKSGLWHGGLGPSIEVPGRVDDVFYYDNDFSFLRDKYPKASVHFLLMPRDKKMSSMHPLEALEDPEFLAKVRIAAANIKVTAAKELQKKFGKFSRQEERRQAVLNGTIELNDDDDLPDGRDWDEEIRVGIHTHPSMSHLHIHVISKDMHSESMKHRKHYNSFNTRFFVNLDEFPLGKGVNLERVNEVRHWPDEDMVCWKCKKNFKNKFAHLKLHLEEEFESWKRE